MDIDTLISLVSLIFAITIAWIGDAGILSFLQRSDVRYIRTHTLKKGSEFVQGIILVNRGKRFTEEIMLKIQYINSVIVSYQVDEDAFLDHPVITCQSGDKVFILSNKRLLPGKKSTIYISITGQEEVPEVSGMYDCQAIAEDLQGLKRPLSDTVAIFLGLFALFWMLLGLFF